LTPYALVLAIGLLHGPGAKILDTEERYATMRECREEAKKLNTGPRVIPRTEARCINLTEFYPE
jgi:hypothetical protein